MAPVAVVTSSPVDSGRMIGLNLSWWNYRSLSTGALVPLYWIAAYSEIFQRHRKKSLFTLLDPACTAVVQPPVLLFLSCIISMDPAVERLRTGFQRRAKTGL